MSGERTPQDAPPVFEFGQNLAEKLAEIDPSTTWTRDHYSIQTEGDVFVGPQGQMRWGTTAVQGVGNNDALFGQFQGIGLTRKAIELETAQGGTALLPSPDLAGGLLETAAPDEAINDEGQGVVLPPSDDIELGTSTADDQTSTETQTAGKSPRGSVRSRAREIAADRLTKGRSKKPAEVRPVHETDASTVTTANRKRPKMTRRQHVIGSLLVLGLTVGSNEVYQSVTGEPMIDVTRPTAPFHGPGKDIQRIDHSFMFQFFKKEIKDHTR